MSYNLAYDIAWRVETMVTFRTLKAEPPGSKSEKEKVG
jgi:hypothetical protein